MKYAIWWTTAEEWSNTEQNQGWAREPVPSHISTPFYKRGRTFNTLNNNGGKIWLESMLVECVEPIDADLYFTQAEGILILQEDVEMCLKLPGRVTDLKLNTVTT